MPDIWKVGVSTWRGMSIGATHYYVKLRSPTHEYELHLELTVSRAAQMTLSDGFTWKAGEHTNRFDTELEAVLAAIDVFDVKSNPGDLLVRGGSEVMPYYGALAGEAGLVRDINILKEYADQIEWWEGENGDEMDHVCDAYEALVKPFKTVDDTHDWLTPGFNAITIVLNPNLEITDEYGY